MDIKLYAALGTLAAQDEMVFDLRQAIVDLSQNKTAILTLIEELDRVSGRRAETFFCKIKPYGYKSKDEALAAYVSELERRHEQPKEEE